MTKTLGYMPKKSKVNSKSKSTIKKKTAPLSGDKAANHSNSNVRVKNASIEGINKVNPANYQSLYKSFQNFPYPTASSATNGMGVQKFIKENPSQAVLNSSAGTSTNNTSQQVLSQKFLKTLKNFT